MLSETAFQPGDWGFASEETQILRFRQRDPVSVRQWMRRPPQRPMRSAPQAMHGRRTRRASRTFNLLVAISQTKVKARIPQFIKKMDPYAILAGNPAGTTKVTFRDASGMCLNASK
jgi:hypothetical protein